MQAGVVTDAWKRSTNDYWSAAISLNQSMALHGFDPNHAIPIDPDGELLNGSHRVACALALGITEVPVEQHTQRVFAPSWGADWFRSNGLDEGTIAALEASLTR